MVAVDTATATELLSRPVSSEDETMRRLAHVLSRSLAAEGISDALIDTLEDVLGDRPGPAPADPSRKLDGLLIRLGLPLPRRPQLLKAAPPLSKEEAARITDRFRRATTPLMHVVPHRAAMYPTDELRRLLALRDERPSPDQALSYLRRYALAIVALLDLMGDDE
ncbi:DUF6415 family natural product biosynthesis protein [Streptomyces sp. NBC_00829]|uniref:DUF6415 family natural product biosynthesis protein n=1 Tax=Streptomyces sp. NBC_00829 TaxID=2903679 RepID=UPI00386C9A51|nr:DUF6415 family natural product biosynthesis protein [Streptomyces sp. NBC_00829]